MGKCTVRSMADIYGLDKNEIGVMGSSDGGHLAALASTYFEPIDFEGADAIDYTKKLRTFEIPTKMHVYRRADTA